MNPKSIRRSLLILGVILPQALASDWQGLYQSGEEKLRRGMAEEASRDLRQSLRGAEVDNVSPVEMAGILDALGRSRFRASKYREAADYFEKALRLADRPGDRAPGLVNAAQAYRELGEYRKSEMYVREALEAAPGDARIWQLLGSVLIKSRQYAEAEAAERKALALGNASIAAVAWSDLAVMEEAKGHPADAAAHLRHAIDSSAPGHGRGRLLVNLGLLEHRARREAEAAGHLREAIGELEAVLGKAHPDLAQALDSYAEVLRRAGRKPEAREASERAREIRSTLAATVDWRDLRSGHE
jgi:tetratricopeptide (TPR) repeat protein